MTVLGKLTIDGTTMSMHDPKYTSTANSTTFPTVERWTEVHRVTLTEPGAYLLYGWITFGAGSTTGAMSHGVRFLRSDSGLEILGSQWVDANNDQTYKSITGFVIVSTTPVDIILEGAASKRITTSSPGVIRTLKIIDIGP